MKSYNWSQEGILSLIKISIAIPEEVYKGVKKASKNFSAVATEALKDYLKKEKEREPSCKVTKSSPGMFATIQTRNYS